MNTKISVIFPVFNVEDYIEDALISLLNQTIIDDIEIIMVDDGSTDNCGSIIEQYAFKYDNFHAYHKENGGLSSSRNYGMKFAKGEYVHFFDSDDRIPNDAYEKMYNFAKTEDYDIVVGDFLKFTSKKTFTNDIRNHVFGNILDNVERTNLVDFPQLSWDMFVWNKLINREFLEKNNIHFYTKNVNFEDNLYSIELYDKAENIGILPEFIYFWRVRDSKDSISQQFDIKRASDLIKIFNLVNDYLIDNIHDSNILEEKYLKWLIFDIPMYVDMIKDYPVECHEWLLDNIYSVVQLIPDHFFENLNSYYKLFYQLINNKDLKNLLILTNQNLKREPQIPKELDPQYVDKLNLKNDARSETLDSYASHVDADDENIIIDLKNFVPYLKNSDEEKITVKLINNSYNDVLFENHYSDNKLIIPIDSINYGENILITNYVLDDINKEYYVKTNEKKTFNYDDFDIDVSRGSTSYLRLIKRKKGEVDFIINDITLEDDELKFKGNSNKKLNSVTLRDYLDLEDISFPINFINDKSYELEFAIPCKNLLNVPVRKWEMNLDDNFNKINSLGDYEFFTNNYLIKIRNYGNKVVISLDLYNPINHINKLNKKLNKYQKKNKNLKIKNKKLNKKIKKLNKNYKNLKNKNTSKKSFNPINQFKKLF